MPYEKPEFGDDDLNDFSRFEDEEELGADREETIEEDEPGEEELGAEERPSYASLPLSPSAKTKRGKTTHPDASGRAKKAKAKPRRKKGKARQDAGGRARPKKQKARSKIRRRGKSGPPRRAKSKRRRH